MAYSSFPFQGQTTTETQYSKLFRQAIPNGVLALNGDGALAVTGNGTGMQVQLATGQAYVQGFCFQNDTPSTLTIEAAGATSRVDTVVLHLDPALDSIVPTVVKGGTDGLPAPLSQTDSGVFELPLAYVVVAPSTLSITAAMVTDQRTFTSSIKASAITDLDLAVAPGHYTALSSCAHLPVASTGTWNVVVASPAPGSVIQLAYRVSSSIKDFGVYQRVLSGGTWTAWRALSGPDTGWQFGVGNAFAATLGITPINGFVLSAVNVRVRGNVASLYISGNFSSTSPGGNTANGDYGNYEVIQLPASLTPAVLTQTIGPGVVGPAFQWGVSPNGKITLVSGPPWTIPGGASASMSGSYLLD